AVSLLGELAVPVTARAVVAFALREDEVHARWRAFWAVTRFERKRTRPALLRALRGKNPTRRWRAGLILSMQGDSASAPEVRCGLDSSDPWIQWEALGAVRSLRLQGVEEAVGRFLDPGKEPSLRQEATLALGAICSKKALELLRAALADPDAEIRWRAS